MILNNNNNKNNNNNNNNNNNKSKARARNVVYWFKNNLARVFNVVFS